MAKSFSDFSQLKHSMLKVETPVETKQETSAVEHDDREEVLAYFTKSLSALPVSNSDERAEDESRRISELEAEIAAKDEMLAELAAGKASAEDRLLKVQEDVLESRSRISSLEDEIARLKAQCDKDGEEAPGCHEDTAVAASEVAKAQPPLDEGTQASVLLEASLAIEEVFPGELREIVISVLKEGLDIAQNAGRERRAALLSQLLAQNTPSRELDSRKNELRQILKDAGSFADVHTIRALEKIGFRLISGKKHWKLAYGNVRLPIAKTPSDYRSNLNSAHEIANRCF